MSDKNEVKNAFGDGGALIRIRNKICRTLAPLYMKTVALLNRPQNKIVFCNMYGKRGYGGDPGAVCDEFIRRNTDTDLVWISRDDKGYPKEVRTVRYRTLAELRELATAAVWVDNARKSSWIRKGKRLFYLQTWHSASPCLKMIEGDVADRLPEYYLKDAKNDSKMADLFLADSDRMIESYRRAFWYDGEVLKCVEPTSEYFYGDWKAIRKEVREFFGLDDGVKLVLFAPTFRDDRSFDDYGMDYGALIRACSERFGGKWSALYRYHAVHDGKNERARPDVINATMYPAIEKLLIACDLYITDFSSPMFKTFRWKINTVLFATDYDAYINNDRPLYFDISELPAAFAHSNEQLTEAILGFSEEEYAAKCEEFNDRIGYYEIPDSVGLIADRLESELRKRI